MTTKSAVPHHKDRNQPVQTVRGVLHWIIETDRRFRVTQARINQFGDRF